jgi:hypothetical protein
VWTWDGYRSGVGQDIMTKYKVVVKSIITHTFRDVEAEDMDEAMDIVAERDFDNADEQSDTEYEFDAEEVGD